MGETKTAKLRSCGVLFAELCGIEELAKTLEIEDYAELHRTIFKKLDEAVLLYGGHIDKHEDKILMATFGVPTAHEDDPERAVRAALLMKTHISSMRTNINTPLDIRIGINLGRVYAGEVGSRVKTEYTVLGEVVNLASRIKDKADVGQVLVSEEVYNIIKPIFEFSTPIRFQPQGVATEINVYPVVRLKTGFIKRRGIEGLSSPLVGRTEELGKLLALLNDLFNKKGNIVFVLGPAGVGKSRLIEELFTHSLSVSLERAQKIDWYFGRCSPYSETIYFPFLEIIKQMCNMETEDDDKTILEKLLHKIKEVLGEEAENVFPYIANAMKIKTNGKYENKIKYLKPDEIKLQTMVAISSLLQACAKKERVVYCIDDLYLADQPSLETLKFFFETDNDLSALFILISRPEKEKLFWKIKESIKQEHNAQELLITPLSPNHTYELTKSLLKIPKISEAMLRQIVNDAEGNPFFLEELIKLLVLKGVLVRRGNEWIATESSIDFEIPYTIEGIVQAGYDNLPVELQNLLSEASVVGRRFSAKILSGFSQYWERLEDLLEVLVDRGYIYTNNQQDYSFYHALVREVIYRSLTEKRRKELHQKVAQTIEIMYRDHLEQVYEILFEHYKYAGVSQKALEYALKAGEVCENKYANFEAISYYLYIVSNLQIKTGEDKKLKMDVLKRLGRIHDRIGEGEDGLKFFSLALELADDRREKALINNLIADAYQSMSNYEKALNYHHQALELLSGYPEEDKVSVELGIAWIKYLQGDYAEAKRILLHGLERLTDHSHVKTRRLLARIYNQLGSVYSHIGEMDASFDSYNKALKIYEILDDERGKAVIYNNICGYYTTKGDYYNALKYLESSLEVDNKTGNMLGKAIATYNIGETYYQLGDFEKAMERYEEYLNINARINNHLGNGYGNLGKGFIFLEKGEFEKAEIHLKKALEIFETLGARSLKMSVMISLAELSLAKGEFEKAFKESQELKNTYEIIDDKEGIFDCLLIMAGSKIRQGLGEKKLLIVHVNEAKSILNQALNVSNDLVIDIDKLFRLYYYLCLANYYLGNPQEMMKNYERLKKILEDLLKNLPDDKAKAKFLSKRIYQEFELFRKNAIEKGSS